MIPESPSVIRPRRDFNAFEKSPQESLWSRATPMCIPICLVLRHEYPLNKRSSPPSAGRDPSLGNLLAYGGGHGGIMNAIMLLEMFYLLALSLTDRLW